MLNACPTEIDFDVYRPRNPKASAYYSCVEDHFEQLETVWDERYQSRFGFWRPYVTDVIQRYLDVICTDGCFYGKGSFKTCPTTPNPKDLEDLFRYEVFKMLKAEGKINDDNFIDR